MIRLIVVLIGVLMITAVGLVGCRHGGPTYDPIPYEER
jgi:hypothetical protein